MSMAMATAMAMASSCRRVSYTGLAMASVMGRSCGYGVHLRSCSPSVSSSSILPNSLASLSHLASCFFLRFSSSSCRNHRFKLCAAPPSTSGSRVCFVHGEAEQEGSSASSPFGLQKLPAMKRASSRKKKLGGGAEVNTSHEASLLEDASSSLLLSAPSKGKVIRRKKTETPSQASLLEDALLLSAPSKGKVTRRKKTETPLQASEESLPGDEKPATSKRTRKKIVLPDIGSMDVETVLAEERLPSKSPRRRKKSTLAEFEDKVEAIALDEPAASFTSSLSQLSSSDAISSTPKRSTRKNKALEVESSTSVENTTSVKVQRRKNKLKEPSVSLESDQPFSETVSLRSSDVVAGKLTPKSTSKVVSTHEDSVESTSEPYLSHEVRNVENSVDKASLTDEMPVISVIDSHTASRRRQSEALCLPKDSNMGKFPSVNEVGASEASTHTSKAFPSILEDSVDKAPLTDEMLPKDSNMGNSVNEVRISEASTYTSKAFPSILENSVDKASLTDEMPVITVTDSHTASRRRQSEALCLPKDSNMGNFSVHEVGASETLTYTSKAFPPILEDSAVKNSGVLEAKKEQIKENESEMFDKVNFVNGANQKGAVSRGIPYKKEDPLSHTSRANNSRGTFRGQGKYAPASMWTEKTNQSKGFPVTTQRWAPNKQGNTYRVLEKSNRSREDINSQHWAPLKKSDTMMKEVAKGAAVQVNQTTSSVQFKTASHDNRDLQQGYNLANINRAYGKEQKKKKLFSIRKVVANQASTTSYMQIFGTGFDTGDTMPTVLLFFDRRRFIFNVGEGLHRFCMEHRFKLSKIDHVFLTRVCSETAGGLPGLILTLAEMGESGLTAQTWGPSSLQDLAQAMHTFVPSGWMEHTHCFGAVKDGHTLIETSSSHPILLLEDELIKISAVLLHSENEPHRTAESVYSEEKNDGVISTVYICELTTVRGKFDPDKAQAKGLKPGFKYGKLQKGQSVMSDDGTIMVHPEDVLGPSSPGPIMFLVDCPSSSYVPSLTSSASLQSYFSQTGKIVNCMIHIGPRSVTRSKDYQSWMENFRETHHIMARKEVKVLGTPTLRYSAKILSKLNLVCPQLFPIVEPDAVDQKEAVNDRVVDGGNLLKYRFRPLTDLGPDVSDVPEAFNHFAAQKHWRTENPEVIRARELAGQVIKRWSQVGSASSSLDQGSKDCQNLPACLRHVSRDEMELVFLGTGSSQPAKHRNVTGIYIHMFEKGGIMLDCGEGTYAQLKRRYGAIGADDVLMGLKCIWISHMHADHFSGLARILSARRQLLQAQSALEPILIVGPKRLKFFLAAYKQVEDLGVEFLDCSQTTLEVQSWLNKKNSEDKGVCKKEGLVSVSSEEGSGKCGMQPIWKRPGFHIQQGIDVAGRESLRRVLNLLGLKDLCSVPVVHCPHAFAVVLEAEGRKVRESKTIPGWKLVFSGDTRPCQALVEAARGATILIHEATFDDGLIAEAVKKNHSMTNEAIQVGVAAQVYRIFLTHFSQRYPTIPSFDNRYSDRTCIAFDMMSVNLADLPIVPKLVPALQLLFRDQTEVEEDLEAVSV